MRKSDLQKLQDKCEKLGIGYRGYPYNRDQVAWVKKEAKRLVALAEKVEKS